MKRCAVLIAVLLSIALQIPVYAGDITFSSDQGDRVSIVRNLRVDEPTDGNTVTVLGNLEIQAHVGGNVVAVLGDITVDSEVSGNVAAIFGKVVLTDHAKVGGSVVAIGEMNKAPGAVVNGPEALLYLGFLPKPYLNVIALGAIILFSIFLLLFGMISIALSKERFNRMSGSMADGMGRKLGIGALAFLGVTVFLPFIAITVIAPVVYFIVLIAAGIVVSIYTGKLVLHSFHSGYSIYLEFFVGFIILTLIKVLLILLAPRTGTAWMLINGGVYILFDFLINALGLGVLIDTRFGSPNRIRQG